MRNYWDPLYYELEWLQLIDKQEVHIKGNASKGKSHLVLDIFKQYHDKALPAIFISAKDFKTEENVRSQILEALDLPSEVTFKTFLDNLNMFGKQKGVKSLLIIDGLNESLRWNIIWESGLSEIRSEIMTGGYENLIFVTTYRTSYEMCIRDSINAVAKIIKGLDDKSTQNEIWREVNNYLKENV